MDQNPTYEDLKKQVKTLQIENNEIRKAKQAINESEAFHRSTLENISDTVIITDDFGRIVYACPNTYNIFGLSQNQIYKKETVQNLINGNICDLSELKTVQEISNIEWNVKDIFGREHFVLITIKAVSIQGGTVLYVMRDITELKESEKALRESEIIFRTVAEQSPSMIFINKNGRIVYANTRCMDMMGFDRDEFYSPEFDFLTLMAPDSLKQAELSFKRHWEGKEVMPLEYTLIKKNGNLIYTMISTKLIDYDGEKAILGVVTDVTEQKNFERILANSKKQWEKTFDAISDWVSIIDKNHNIIRSNNASKDLFGLLPKHLVGKRCYEIVHGMDVPVPDCPLKNTLIESHPNFMEFQSEDGRWLKVSVDPIKRENKDDLFVHIVRDITERKKAERQKDRLVSDLRKALSKINILSGLLPICSHCKKIRDDKGYWNQIESYIQDHSEAEFSHSICEECAKKYYPDMDIYGEDET